MDEIDDFSRDTGFLDVVNSQFYNQIGTQRVSESSSDNSKTTWNW